MKKYWMIVLTLLALLVIIVVNSMGKTRDKSEKAIIVFMPKEYSDVTTDFWISMINGAKAAAEELDVELVVNAPEREVEYRKQQLLIEDVIKNKPNAIVLCPCSPIETYPYAKKIEETGIPLVIVDSRMEENVGQCLVSTDNVKAGKLLGAHLKEHISAKDEIGIVSHVEGSSTAVEREQGFRTGLGEKADNIVDVVFSDSNYERAYMETKKMLLRHPDIKAIVGLNEYSAVGAAKAIVDLGREDIVMMGFDSSLEEIQFLEEGVFDAIVIQYPFNMGYLGVMNAYKLAQGQNVEPEVDSGTTLITKDKLYTEENQRNLFPFS